MFRNAYASRSPIAGSLALTHRCNLRCIHCYLQRSRDGSELSKNAWLEIIDRLETAGCLWLTLTGGEPLHRPDFADIYLHAKRKGFLVTVFTNGTLIDDSTIELFTDWPPHLVEISLYGHSPETYRAVTGDANARHAAYDAIPRLQQAGVPLKLKTVALRQNAHELTLIERHAQHLEADFRFDTLVSACLDGSHKPCSSRLDEDSTIRLDLEDRKRHQAWRDCLDEQRLPRRSLFTCGAGMTSFHVHADGYLALCLNDIPLHDLTRGSFSSGWNGPVRERRETSLPPGHPCSGCRDQPFCGVCPPLARMETGSDFGLPLQLCQTGRRRLRAIQEHAGMRP